MRSSQLPPIFVAAGAGNLAELARLLAHGSDVDEVLSVGNLDESTKYQVAIGVASGEDYAHYEISGPLAFAIASGQTAAALALLNAGASTGALKRDSMPPLAVAVREGNAEVVRELLRRGASATAGYETTVLYEAASRGHAEILQLLLAAGAKVDEHGNEEGETALHAAAREGHRTIVELLLSRGASKNSSSEEGTPADVAQAHGHADLVSLLT